jgi:Protein of unknown function (DUF2568)
VLIAVWGVWVAPASEQRLSMPWLLIAKLVVFGPATVALVAVGRPRLGAMFAALVVLNLGLVLLWGRP